MSKHIYNKNFFEAIDTENKAYWLGFLYADGCNFQKNGNYFLSICLSKNDEIQLINFKKDINSTHNIRYSPAKEKYIGNRTFKSGEMCQLQIWSTKFCKDLDKLGCSPKKTFNLKFPTENQVPKHLIRHFIRGYFDGDGAIFSSFSRKGILKNFIFQLNGTKEFLYSISEYFSKNHVINSSPYINLDGKIYKLRIGGNLKVINVFLHLYKDANIFLPRKLEIFKKLIQQHNSLDKNIGKISSFF